MDAVDTIIEKALTDIILAFGVDDKSQIPRIKAEAKEAVQQEIAKAQIRILKQEQSWIEDVNRDIGWSIGQTIDSLSQTLKEHKEQ